MKKFVFVFLMMAFSFSNAYCFDAGLGILSTTTKDDSIRNEFGVEMTMEWKERWKITPLLKISSERAYKYLYGQGIGKYSLTGVRAGVKIPSVFFKDLSLTFDIGYYFPFFDFADEGPGQEGVYAAMHKLADEVNGGIWSEWEPGGICCESTDGVDYIYDTCTYKVKGNIGGSVGINYTHFWGRIGITGDARYRYLELRNRMRAEIQGLYEGAYHDFTGEDNMSGWQIFFGIVIKLF